MSTRTAYLVGGPADGVWLVVSPGLQTITLPDPPGRIAPGAERRAHLYDYQGGTWETSDLGRVYGYVYRGSVVM